MGFSNTIGTLPGMFTPSISAYIVQNKVTINSAFNSDQPIDICFVFFSRFICLLVCLCVCLLAFLPLNIKLASEWHTVFYLTAGVYLFGAIFYGVFASGERQSWAAAKTK